MELVRAILLRVEAKQNFTNETITIDGYDPEIVARHVELLFDNKLLDGRKSKEVAPTVPAVLVFDLTWEGHEFVATLRDDNVWGKIKQKISPTVLATLPFDVLKTVGITMVTRLTMNQLGLTP